MVTSELPLPELLSRLLPAVLREFDASTLSELDVRYGDFHLTLRRQFASGGGAVTAPPVSAVSTDVVGEPEASDHIVTAQMVGTFYLTTAPGKPPLVQEGDIIEKGQVIGIIEAMKVMNEVEADVSGRVKKILVTNQQPVEYGQPLMVIVPE